MGQCVQGAETPPLPLPFSAGGCAGGRRAGMRGQRLLPQGKAPLQPWFSFRCSNAPPLRQDSSHSPAPLPTSSAGGCTPPPPLPPPVAVKAPSRGPAPLRRRGDLDAGAALFACGFLKSRRPAPPPDRPVGAPPQPAERAAPSAVVRRRHARRERVLPLHQQRQGQVGVCGGVVCGGGGLSACGGVSISLSCPP